MKKLITPALLVAGLSASLLVGATSVSWAQEGAPSCAQALGNLTDAQNADAVARRDDTIAAEADAKADAAEAADSKLADAVKAAADAGVPSANQNDAFLTQIKAIPQGDANFNLAQAQIPKIQAVLDAKAEAAKTDAAGLRAQATGAKANADKTDATKTGAELVAARTAANDACEGQPTDEPEPTTTPTTPPATEPPADNNDPADLDCDDFATPAAAQAALDADPADPNVLDVDGDGLACETGVNDDPAPVDNDDNGLNPGPIVGSVVTPVGGVETGGGPA